VSGELFTLTYGALVAQLLKDYEDADSVNRQLDKIGYNMGLRMIDDFLAKNPTVGKCVDMREVADVLAKQGFKLYLGALSGEAHNDTADILNLQASHLPYLVGARAATSSRSFSTRIH
jgi:hypothetical protein